MEIGSRWQRISQGQKDHYKKLAEEQQKQYKVHLDIWLKVSGERGALGTVALGGAWHRLCSQPSSGNRCLQTLLLAFGNWKGTEGAPCTGSLPAPCLPDQGLPCLRRASRPRNELPTRNTLPT